MRAYRVGLLSSLVILVLIWTLGGVVVCNASIVALWLFDEGNGNNAVDSSGNENHGAIHDADWVEGRFGSALEFDGEASYVEVAESNSLKITDQLSWHAWIKVTGNAGRDRIIFAQSNNGGYGGRIYTGEGYSCWVRVSDDWRYPAPPANVPDLYDTWHHVATTYDSTGKFGEQRMYVDGELASEGPIELVNLKIQPGTGTSEIGNRHEWTQPFKGIIDELCIYDVILTQDEIQESMSSLGKTAVGSAGKLATTWGGIKVRSVLH